MQINVLQILSLHANSFNGSISAMGLFLHCFAANPSLMPCYFPAQGMQGLILTGALNTRFLCLFTILIKVANDHLHTC